MAATRLEPTPQRINGKRFTIFPTNRRKNVAAEVAAAHAALEDHHARAALAPFFVQPTAAAALAAGETQLGLPYGITACRCSLGYCSRRDCSGEVIFAVNSAGLAFPCTSSFAIAQFGRDHDDLISMDEAIHTPGAVGVRNPWGDPNFNGSNGHVWLCKGDGKTTVEEGGHATGCYRGSVFTKSPHGELVVWMRFPGLLYVPERVRGDGEMILQTHADGTLKPSTVKGRHAGHQLTPDGTGVLGLNGGSVDHDQKATQFGPTARLWVPFAIGPGQSMGISRRANNTGLIAQRSDGVEASIDYS
jgi:hypothetical protein